MRYPNWSHLVQQYESHPRELWIGWQQLPLAERAIYLSVLAGLCTLWVLL
jgi:hypothetical protein